MAKTATKAKTNGGNWLNMNEPELFEKIRASFATRGLGGMPLAMMVRIAITEWIEANERYESAIAELEVAIQKPIAKAMSDKENLERIIGIARAAIMKARSK